MDYDLDDAVAILARTPGTLRAMLSGVPDAWVRANEGAGTWSPFDVVGHLIHGERTDWIPRAEHILQHGDAVPFTPFDREAMFEASTGQSLDDLLETFAELRRASLARLEALNLGAADLLRHGSHPDLGPVEMRQLLATWVAHDLGHISQIARTMAHQYRDAVGPWRKYLSVLDPGVS